MLATIYKQHNLFLYITGGREGVVFGCVRYGVWIPALLDVQVVEWVLLRALKRKCKQEIV